MAKKEGMRLADSLVTADAVIVLYQVQRVERERLAASTPVLCHYAIRQSRWPRCTFGNGQLVLAYKGCGEIMCWRGALFGASAAEADNAGKDYAPGDALAMENLGKQDRLCAVLKCLRNEVTIIASLPIWLDAPAQPCLCHRQCGNRPL